MVVARKGSQWYVSDLAVVNKDFSYLIDLLTK